MLFYRLLVNCDDFGRFDARPAVIRGKLFPLKDVTMTQVENALIRLSTVGIAALYQVDGRPYLQLCTWAKHQSIRAKKSRYPAPGEGPEPAVCEQLQADACNCGSNPIQSKSIQSSAAAAEKTTFGEFGNVLLTPAERDRLNGCMGGEGAAEYIERLSGYLAQSGRRYRSHYAVLLNWWRRDEKPVRRGPLAVETLVDPADPFGPGLVAKEVEAP